jgi:ribosomal protein S12 methylthiotransferase
VNKPAQMSSSEPRIGFVSLGCPKALVDSEQILSRLRAEGYGIAADYAGADLVVVNTCGFIDSAIAESLDAIGEALAENGRVVVTGCLGRDAARIRSAYPEVLAVTGPQAFEEVMAAVHERLPPPHDPFASLVPPQGIKLTPRHYAYLKISEGCNHRCSFCIIPSLRGDLVSRPIGEILGEAQRLAAAGVRELLVISQDTSAYGADLRYRTGFVNGRPIRSDIASLVDALGELGIWVRLHYVYPYPHVDRLIPQIAAGRLLPYLDMPLQHGHPRILKAMRRPAAAEKVLERIRRWREQVPELVLRSTFIVGFPGETEAEFAALLDFLQEAQLDRVGAFAYSPVEGAAANALPGAVPEAEKQTRLEAFMATQAGISATRLQSRIGGRETVLVDGRDDEGTLVARSRGDAPEIDGVVYVEGADVPAGSFLEVEITGATDHDLFARVV